MLVVETHLLEEPAVGRTRTRDHVGELARDVEVTAAVVADVQHEVVDPGVAQLLDRRDQLLLGRGDVIVEQHVADAPERVVDGLHVLHGRRRDGRRLHRDDTRRNRRDRES
jgi:hypothetical protein